MQRGGNLKTSPTCGSHWLRAHMEVSRCGGGGVHRGCRGGAGELMELVGRIRREQAGSRRYPLTWRRGAPAISWTWSS